MVSKKPEYEILRHYNFFQKTDAGFAWLARSIDVNDTGGSSGYYHILKGWSDPYPETSGYIINTFLDYYSCFPDLKYFKPALDLGRWLVELYAKNQFFPGGIGVNNRRLVFDSAQILHGLGSLYSLSQDPYYRSTVMNTFEWLVETTTHRDKWLKNSFSNGFIPAYHTHVIWILLESAEKLSIRTKLESLHSFIDQLIENASTQNWVEDYGPELNCPISTHFIGYTLQGILECGDFLKNYDYIRWVRKTCDIILGVIKRNGMLAGQFEAEWNPDTRFSCLVGNAQFSYLYSRLFELTNESEYFNAAVVLLNSVAKRQSHFISGGGIPGSHPLWGPYQRFRYPNWAVKFFLDAYLKLFSLKKKLKTELSYNN